MSRAPLDGRVLITGATGGLGAAMARALHARGASLVLTGRRAAILEDLSANSAHVPSSVTWPTKLRLRALPTKVGEIDILVANAALPASGELVELSIAEIDRCSTSTCARR